MTTKNEENQSFPFWLKFILAIFVILILAFLVFVIFKYITSLTDGFIPDYPDRNDWGVFGDFFGGLLNPIFGFASFLALLATIYYQARELNASTKELRNSATALAAQNKAIELQSFEQTFFSWLNIYRSLLDSIEYVNGTTKKDGRQALIQYRRRYIQSFNSEILAKINDDGNQLLIKIKNSWESLYATEESQLDSLFRSLYRLFLWVDKNTKINISEKWLYISIIRSQLSHIEMVYLFYNCLTDRGHKFKPLVEKYAIFDNFVFNQDKTLTLFKLEYSDEAYSSDLARNKLDLTSVS